MTHLSSSSSAPLALWPKAVLFDHDGVLVASEPLHWHAWGELLRELGLPYHESEIRALVGKTAPQILATVLDKHRPGWRPEDYDLNALAQRKNHFYLAEVGTRLTTYPSVPELLQWLKSEGVKTAVVSNARRRELVTALEAVKLAGLFDLIVSRDDVGASKPDPTPYLFAAASVGAETHEALAVEDSPPGIESALVGRIPAAAVLTNFPRSAMEQPVPGRPDLKPVWIGESMRDLFESLKARRESR